MKKLANYCPLILLFLFATPKVNAQSVDVVIRDNGKERQESIELPKSMTYPLDSLLNDWKAKNYIDLGKDCSTAEINPLFSDFAVFNFADTLFSAPPYTSTAYHACRPLWKCHTTKLYVNLLICMPDACGIKSLLC